MAISIEQSRRGFAYDISNNVISKGEIFDVDVINQSIQNILSTTKGERIFFPDYGSILSLVVFENVTATNGEQLLDQLLDDVERWEDRITIIRADALVDIDSNNNSMILEIPYFINDVNITSTFVRKVRF